MKRFLLLSSFMLCLLSYAQQPPETEGNEVTLTEVDPAGTTSHHKAPPLLPQVFIDGEELSVLSPYVIDPAQIIIRDVNDDIIYNVYVILPASTYMMILPTEVNALKYKIELIYGDHHLVGYF